MRQLVFGLILGLACSAFGETVADRVAKQNALFEEYYQAGLRNFPERATQYGDYRYNSQLGQVSLADIARQHEEADDFLARLKAMPTDGMSDNDVLSHRILEKQLEREDVNYALKNYEMPVNQQNGVHTRLADLPNAVPLDSVPHYQDYISRLHQISRVLEQTTEVMRQGEKDHLDAAQAGCREVARSMRRRHRREPIPCTDQKISGGIFGARQETPDRGDHQGG
jgi:uncharacterized protein (DUF885 family)